MKKNSIKDIMVPVKVVLGETNLKLEEVASIAPGTLISLNSLAGEPVNLLAAGEKIAEGEVVIMDENFGIRVTSIIENGE